MNFLANRLAASFALALTLSPSAFGQSSDTPKPKPRRFPAACLQQWGKPQMIDCYLNDPSDSAVAEALRFTFNIRGEKKYVNWADWPAGNKIELRAAFADTVAWYNGGMHLYPGTLAQDPPHTLNESELRAEQSVDPKISYDAAWSIYKGHVALMLAAEIYHWVPWSIRDYDYSLSSSNLFWFHLSQCDLLGNYCMQGSVTPAPAIYTFKFLKTNNLIGSTRLDTIGRVLDWSRSNLQHSFIEKYADGHWDGVWYAAHETWGYWGRPPVSRTIEGTIGLSPYYASLGLSHWTDGCSGTTGFLEWVLKVVNIPVGRVSADGHAQPHFISENLYLSHGDDPYTETVKAQFPATLLLIDQAKYDSFFVNKTPKEMHDNVGRRTYELALEYPGSPYLMTRYCDDLKAKRSHADSRVYNDGFKMFYTVHQVESALVWKKLAHLASCPVQ